MLQKLISKHSITFLGINQVKPVIGSLYPQLSYKGGEAWKYQCSVRLLFSKGKLFDINDNEVNNSFDTPNGHKINVKVNKTKICPADRLLTFFTLNYNDGIDVIGDTIDVAVTLGVIERRGSWFFLPGDKKFQGRNGVKAYFLEDLDYFQDFYSSILRQMKE